MKPCRTSGAKRDSQRFGDSTIKQDGRGLMTKAVLGIIGGSGIYDLPGLAKVRSVRLKSPWGEPSAALRVGEIAGLPVVFLPRHDRGHRLSPSDINYRANIDVLKRAGVTDLISLSACGSFKEELPPGTFVLIDQFVDRTHKRESSFFGKGCVAHVSMAHPVSPRLRIHLAEAAMAEDVAVVRDGTYVCIEGPQFSSLAESLTYKNLGYSVIGMTNMPEAKLAREAEISYATVAMVTDFDCWHPDHDAVTVQDIIKVLIANAEKAKRLVARLARDFPRDHEPCPIGSDRALDNALITAPDARDPKLLKKLDAVAGRILQTAQRPARRPGAKRATKRGARRGR
jgi:5'-methylthioadenosine phosphorylase